MSRLHSGTVRRVMERCGALPEAPCWWTFQLPGLHSRRVERIARVETMKACCYPIAAGLCLWRSRWDSNPRYGITVHRISSPAHSTTLPPLLIRFAWCEGPHFSALGRHPPARLHPRLAALVHDDRSSRGRRAHLHVVGGAAEVVGHIVVGGRALHRVAPLHVLGCISGCRVVRHVAADHRAGHGADARGRIAATAAADLVAQDAAEDRA